MQAKLFIDLLERQELLDPEILAALRKQVAESNSRLTPENIAKLLVDNGQLSRFQATKLIASLKEGSAKPETPAPAKPNKSASMDELGFADDATAASAKPSKAKDKDKKKDDSEDSSYAAIIVDDDDVVEVDAVDDVVDVSDTDEVEVVDVVEVIDSEPAPKSSRFRTDSSSASAPAAAAATSGLEKLPVATIPKASKPQKNKWESRKFLAPFFLFLLLLVPFIGLVIWQFSQTSEEALQTAQDAYEARDYEAAVKRYEKFVEGFPTNAKVSFAKVRIALSTMRNAIERNTDPNKSLEVVKETLPKISAESGLAEERPDLAGALLALAEKFNTKADSAKTTEDKEVLLKGFDEHWQFMSNATYFGSQERTQFEKRMAEIRETRQRIEQDIIRAKDLAATSQKIASELDAKNVNDAFQLRKDLIRRHPQLEVEPVIRELVDRATGILKDLIQSASEIPAVATEDPNQVDGKSIVLANVRGKKLEGANDVAYVRVKGSVYALNVSDGSVLWRRFVGRGMADPVRVNKEADSDLLLSIPGEGVLQRVQARDGKLVWHVKFQGEIVEPVVDRDDLLVGTKSGNMFCLDVVSGQVRWGKKLPQTIDVGACLATGRDFAYVVGDQSSLYVMSRKDGRCEEVIYIGQLKNSVRVPPVYALGHVLLFENGAGFSNVRILKTNDSGAGLVASQTPMRMQGNVVVPAQSEGRRITIMTDRGEIAVLDIEPSNEKNQVAKIAGIVANETQPRIGWPLVDKNELWIASSRFIRYEIQVSRQELVREWIREEGDEFVARPQRFGDQVIHSRYVRGTDGVRISCVNGKTGDPTWEADLGVPVSVLNLGANNAVQAITTQAALFSIDAAAREKGMAVPTENPGRNQRQLLFSSPVRLADGRIVALNKNQNNQLALFDPKGAANQTLRVLVMASGGVDASCDPISVGNNVLIPASNGQIVMIDPSNGKQVSEAFQPAVAPGASYKWLKPALLSDKQTIVAADNNQRMFRIGTGKQFRALNEVSVPNRLKGQLAALGDVVIGVTESPSGDVVQCYSGLDLAPAQSLTLQGNVIAGPFVLESVGYVLSDAEGLVAFDSQAKKLWESKIPEISMKGEPQRVGDDIIIVGVSGEILRISAQDGKLIGSANVGEMISASPVVLPAGVVLAGDEGTVFTVKMPDTVGSSGE